MNNKLLLQDLTDQLAEAGKIKKKDAEEFLRAFFKISEDALFEDGIVKINGLGTLKLVLVDARKSVNVSTGEEFEIREHYKVSFVPDAELKSAVNQPYAHLEPVELDPVVETSNASAEKKSMASKEKAPKVEVEEKPTKPKNPKKMKRSTIAWILFFLLIVLFGAWSLISNLKHNREEAAKVREIAQIDSLEADANLQADLAALEEEGGTDSIDAEAADDSLESVIQSVANETGVAKPTPEAVVEKPVPVKAAASKTAAPATKTATPVTKPIAPVTKTPAPVAKATEIKPTAPTVAKQVSPTTKSTATVAKATDVKTTSPTTVKAAPVKTAIPAKTTAPVEYIATVVLKPGDRLNLLSLKYYGDKIFWVYIYQANKDVIPNPDNVPVGITVRIPKPDPKLIDPKNEALVAKAKALQLKYIGAQ